MATVGTRPGEVSPLVTDGKPNMDDDLHGSLAYPWAAADSAAAQGWQYNCFVKPTERWASACSNLTFIDFVQILLPCIRWLRTYRFKEYLLYDLLAGVAVGFMVVPQGMSYARIAGVPAVFGLYGAFIPCLVYAVFGSSRQLAVGPVAVTSFLIAEALHGVVQGSDDITNPDKLAPSQVSIQQLYNEKAIQLSFIVACMYTVVGLLRLGFLTNFLSHSTISGFTTGASVLIGTSQVKYLLGVKVPRRDTFQEQCEVLLEALEAGGFQWREFVMGMCILFQLLLFKHIGQFFPRLTFLKSLGPITACVIGIVTVYAGDLEGVIATVGTIPKGLPHPTVQYWFIEGWQELVPLAVVVMLVDLLESTSIARALAIKNGYRLVANQEIVGLGLANFGGAAFSAYTTTGSFSRSAVNNDAGAKTPLANFVTGIMVMLVLVVLTPVFQLMPTNVMGAIVISGVMSLFDIVYAYKLLKVNIRDFLVWLAAFIGTLFLGVELGLAISIGLALLIVIYQSAFPNTAVLGRVGESPVYRNVKQYPDANVMPGVCVVRIDAPIYFANTMWIQERIQKYLERAETVACDAGLLQVEFLVLDLSPVSYVDAGGLGVIEDLLNSSNKKGRRLILANPNWSVTGALAKLNLPEKIGREWIFVRVHDAIHAITQVWLERGDQLPRVIAGAQLPHVCERKNPAYVSKDASA